MQDENKSFRIVKNNLIFKNLSYELKLKLKMTQNLEKSDFSF